MKHVLVLALIFCGAFTAQAQTKIKLEDISKHVGDSVEVCGQVAGGRYLQSAQGSPTLINVGGQFPNQLLTVVIFGEFRGQFPASPETNWVGKEICVTGKVELYKEKPQIVVRSASQVIAK